MESAKTKRKATGKTVESAIALIKQVDEICRNCGDKSMTNCGAYFRKALYVSQPGKFWYGMFLNCAFYYGNVAKDHFRLVAIAVDTDHQGFGLGTMMLTRIMQRCEENNIPAITFRTHKLGEALEWWKKQGAVIVGSKGEDYEMRITL